MTAESHWKPFQFRHQFCKLQLSGVLKQIGFNQENQGFFVVFFRIQSVSVTFVPVKVSLNVNLTYFNYYAKQTFQKRLRLQNFFFLLMLSFECRFRFFLTESYLHLYFRFIISLQFLLAKFPIGFCLIAQEDFDSLFFKDIG